MVEPLFEQIKQVRSFRQFLLWGFDQVRGEWAMICTAHDLLKLAEAGHQAHSRLTRLTRLRRSSHLVNLLLGRAPRGLVLAFDGADLT